MEAEHGGDSVIERIGNAGSLIEDDHGGGEAHDGVRLGRQGDDAGSVGQDYGFPVEAVATASHAHGGEESARVPKEDVGLAL